MGTAPPTATTGVAFRVRGDQAGHQVGAAEPRDDQSHAHFARHASDTAGDEGGVLFVPTDDRLDFESTSVSNTLSIFAPGMPNTYSTPCASKLCTNNLAPVCELNFVAAWVIFSLLLLWRDPRPGPGAG